MQSDVGRRRNQKRGGTGTIIDTSGRTSLYDEQQFVVMGRFNREICISDQTPPVYTDALTNLAACSGGTQFLSLFNPPIPEEWARGVRAWGGHTWDRSTDLPCQFQQDPLRLNDWAAGVGIQTDEVRAAAGDMFVNWIYDSFQARSWGNSTQCTNPGTDISGDTGLPWLTRSRWMNTYVLPDLANNLF